MHETRVPGALTTNAGSATHARRPGAVTILAVLQLLNAAFFGLIFLGLLADGSSVLEALSGEAGAGAEPVSEIAVATVSILILLLAGLLITDAREWWVGLVVIVSGYVAIEALVRRRFLRLLLNLTIVLAIIAGVIVVVTNLPVFVAAGLLAIGFLILRDNVRELRNAR